MCHLRTVTCFSRSSSVCREKKAGALSAGLPSLAEEEGFEPSAGVSPRYGLANRSRRPLEYSSAFAFRRVSLPYGRALVNFGPLCWQGLCWQGPCWQGPCWQGHGGG